MSGALDGRRVLVTGGTGGIGQAIAIAAGETGPHVAFCGLTEEGSDVTCDAIERVGRRAYFEALDLCDLDRARCFARNAIGALGGMDALVNNAGRNCRGGVRRATREDIEQRGAPQTGSHCSSHAGRTGGALSTRTWRPTGGGCCAGGGPAWPGWKLCERYDHFGRWWYQCLVGISRGSTQGRRTSSG